MTGSPPSVVISEGDAESGEGQNKKNETTTEADIEKDRRTDKPGQYVVSEVNSYKGLIIRNTRWSHARAARSRGPCRRAAVESLEWRNGK